MDSVHELTWLKHLQRQTSWYCDVDPSEHEVFTSKNELVKHVKSVHCDRIPTTMLSRMLKENVLISSKDLQYCPLCDEVINLANCTSYHPIAISTGNGGVFKDLNLDPEFSSTQPNLPPKNLLAMANQLKAKNKHIRRAAIKALGIRPDLSGEFLSALVSRLDDHDYDVQLAARTTLKARSDLASEIFSLLASQLDKGDEKVRNTIVQILGTRLRFPNKLVPTLISQLGNKEECVRRSTIHIFITQPDLSKEVLSTLIERLDDENGNVRRSVVQILKNRQNLPNKILSTLIKRLDDENGNVRRAAVQILKNRKNLPNEFLSTLGNLMSDKNENLQRGTLQILGGRSHLPEELLVALANRLEDENENVRRVAVQALGSREDQGSELLSHLAKRLGNKDTYVRQAIILIFGARWYLPPRRIYSALLDRSKDKDGNVRRDAKQILNMWPDSTTQSDSYNGYFSDDDVAKIPGTSLDFPDELLSALESQLEDEDEDIRYNAVQSCFSVLASFRAGSSRPYSLISALRRRLEDKNEDVRFAALKSLEPNSLSQTYPLVTSRLDHNGDDHLLQASKQTSKARADLLSELFSALGSRLVDDNNTLRFPCIQILGARPELSSNFFLSLLSKLKDDNQNTRYNAELSVKARQDLSSQLFLALASRLNNEDQPSHTTQIAIQYHIAEDLRKIAFLSVQLIMDDTHNVNSESSSELASSTGTDRVPDSLSAQWQDRPEAGEIASLPPAVFTDNLFQENQEQSPGLEHDSSFATSVEHAPPGIERLSPGYRHCQVCHYPPICDYQYSYNNTVEFLLIFEKSCSLYVVDTPG